MTNYKKNFIYSFLGLVVPIAVSIPVIGALARLLGSDYFAVFLLYFALIGYSSVLDVGVSRALVLFVSQNEDVNSRKEFYNTSLAFVIFIACLISGFFLLFNGVAFKFFGLPPEDFGVFFKSFFWVCLAIPFYVASVICSAYYEGVQNFKKINMLKIFFNPLVSIIPLLIVIFFDRSIVGASLGVFIARVIVATFVFLGILDVFDVNSIKFNKLFLMLRYSGWITISNVFGPLMSFLDRFILSYFHGVSGSSYYVAAADFSQRFGILAGAVDKVLFPIFSKNKNNKNYENKAIIFSLLILFIFLLPLIFFSPRILELWLGSAFNPESGVIVQVLMTSLMLFSFSVIPYSYIQARGYSRLTALLHFFEFIPFVLILMFSAYNYGALGVALCVLGRGVFEFLFLFLVAKKLSFKENY